jgi:hypothetical protein
MIGVPILFNAAMFTICGWLLIKKLDTKCDHWRCELGDKGEHRSGSRP